ncbi:hypothetical protein [Pontibacter rugosus]|uniref:Uncharacterized protein n=1 Tax=Pontibacter rugosus TaxID=1745966 RepID=A0ABW3SJ12_9BACT
MAKVLAKTVVELYSSAMERVKHEAKFRYSRLQRKGGILMMVLEIGGHFIM